MQIVEVKSGLNNLTIKLMDADLLMKKKKKDTKRKSKQDHFINFILNIQ